MSDISINALTPPIPLLGAFGDGVTDESYRLQALINYASLNNKKLFLPARIFAISEPLKLPLDVAGWGLELVGVKSERKYQHLPSTRSTIIKAISAMPVMITNRDVSGNSGFYHQVKKLVLDGNNLTGIGYENGYQDVFSDNTVVRCGVGVRYGDRTNASLLKSCTLTGNGEGFVSDGIDSTVFTVDDCGFRENVSDGIVLKSGLGINFSNIISESNGGRGLYIKGDTLLRNITFGTGCYWENNGGYDIEIENGVTIPLGIHFDKIYILSHSANAINLNGGENINFDYPMLNGTGGSANALGYLVNNGAKNVRITGEENEINSVNMPSAKAGEIIRTLTKFDKAIGTVHNQVFKAPIVKPDTIIIGAGITLTPKQVSGTIITNSKQTAPTTVIIPSPTENYAFNVICSKTSEFAWRFEIVGGAPALYIAGSATPRIALVNTTPTLGDVLEFLPFRTSGGVYAWIVNIIAGNWVLTNS